MSSLTSEKLDQAARLVAASGADVWMIFDRETSDSGDPVLPLILEGALTWQSALLVAADGRRVAIVGNYDAGPLEGSGDWTEVVPYVQSIREPLLAALDRLVPCYVGPVSEPAQAGCHPEQSEGSAFRSSGLAAAQKSNPRIAIDFSSNDVKADGLSHGMYLLLEEYLRGTRFEGALVNAEDIVIPLRGRKTGGEVERMRDAIAETERLFQEISAFARSGRTEREVYDHVHARMEERRLGFAWARTMDPIVNSGPDSVIGHGVPSSTIRIAPSHILHVDLGVVKEGYSSDMQRCWYVPEPSEDAPPPDVLRALEAVNGAISAGAVALRPGTAGWEVDAAARAYLQAAGYPEYLHALGHQVGRVAHDGGGILGPRWDRYGRTPYLPVEPDQVYTLELGVMVEGRGYLGLEEMVRVTADGCECLTARQTILPLLSA